jgi:hypothetical protein
LELYTIEKIAIDLDNIASTELSKSLNENNIKVTGIYQTLKEIAAENKVTPSALYELLSSKYKKHGSPGAGESISGCGKSCFSTQSVAAMYLSSADFLLFVHPLGNWTGLFRSPDNKLKNIYI